VSGRGRWHSASALLASALVWGLPRLAHACPMCFDGNNSNQDAFLWGSLFLMFVPTIAIGSLLWWAYRRARALEEAPPAPRPAAAAHTADVGAPAKGLRIVR
jgi:membrane protease YdiL (CAAX protease family)